MNLLPQQSNSAFRPRGTAPYHWKGELSLLIHVFSSIVAFKPRADCVACASDVAERL